MNLEVKKASGIYITITDGKRYIDLISGIGVSNMGHRNHRVANAIRKQVGKYWHTMVYGEHIQSPQVKLAQKLTSLLPPSLNSCYFVNSGSEAIEGALKLAKRFTGKTKIVAMKNAYHGSTHGALSLMNNNYFTEAFRPLLPNVHFAEFNNEENLNLIDEQTACVVLEIVQAEAGYLAPNPDFLENVRERCNQTNTLLIVDEIQTAMGRTGSLFAFEQYNLVPDIICLAKAFGGGMPLGAFVANKNTMQCLTDNPVLGHITTFGGHPVSCAAAFENLKVLTTSGLIKEVSKKEELFRNLLQHPEIVEITGKGLMLGVQLKSKEKLQKTVDYCLQKGLMIDWFLFAEDKLRIAPPLIITLNEIKKSCKIILEGLER
ncbi:MAG: aspartate aminotransferase family protein [Flavobacteriales bacterium]|nr:aspartate aminotransferase family protein [Flavobacteriales bacterium]